MRPAAWARPPRGTRGATTVARTRRSTTPDRETRSPPDRTPRRDPGRPAPTPDAAEFHDGPATPPDAAEFHDGPATPADAAEVHDGPSTPPDAALPACPPPSDPWTRKLPLVGGALTFNELLPTPAVGPNDPVGAFIELYNQQAIDLDVSGWSLGGDVAFTFPEGTFVAGGGTIVVAANPAALAAAAPGALVVGPLAEALPNDFEVTLRSNTRRLMDSVEVGRTPLWALPAAATGQSVCKRDPDLGSPAAENWTLCVAAGGTPGAPNFDRAAAPGAAVLIGAAAEWRAAGAPEPTIWRPGSRPGSMTRAGRAWRARSRGACLRRRRAPSGSPRTTTPPCTSATPMARISACWAAM